jgi:hypothetical protein
MISCFKNGFKPGWYHVSNVASNMAEDIMFQTWLQTWLISGFKRGFKHDIMYKKKVRNESTFEKRGQFCRNFEKKRSDLMLRLKNEVENSGNYAE